VLAFERACTRFHGSLGARRKIAFAPSCFGRAKEPFGTSRSALRVPPGTSRFALGGCSRHVNKPPIERDSGSDAAKRDGSLRLPTATKL